MVVIACNSEDYQERNISSHKEPLIFTYLPRERGAISDVSSSAGMDYKPDGAGPSYHHSHITSHPTSHDARVVC